VNRGKIRIVVSALLAAVATASTGVAAVPARPAHVVLIPDQIRNERGRTLSEVWDLEERAVYLFSPGSRGTRIINRTVGRIQNAEPSPCHRFMAYAFVDKYPPDQQDVWAIHTPSVIITDMKGIQIDSIPNGTVYSWSPSGNYLAVSSIAKRPLGRQPVQDTLVVWSAITRTATPYLVSRLGGTHHWAGEDTVVTGGNRLIRTTGHVLTGGPTPLNYSPDNRYSLGESNDGRFSVVDHVRGTDLTFPVIQEAGLQNMRGVGKAAWVPGSTSRHLLTFTSCDSVRGREGRLDRVCTTNFVDVKALRMIGRVPGVLVRALHDQVILFGKDGLVFADAPSIRFAYDGSAPKWTRETPPVRIEISAQDWSSLRVGPDPLPVRVQTHIAAPGEWIREDKGVNVLRVLRRSGPHAVLVELDPYWGVSGSLGVGDYSPLVVLSRQPQRVHSQSVCGGTILQIRFVEDQRPASKH
jgi:hypothetical protein